MLPRCEGEPPLCSWTNGRKADTYLRSDSTGYKWIEKIYRPGHLGTLLWEHLATNYLSKRLTIVPRVLEMQLARRRLCLSYLPGTRVLEWVLERYGNAGLDLADFCSFHGLDTNVEVNRAFDAFKRDDGVQAAQVRAAIKESYAAFHRLRVLHGCADPRNIIFQSGTAYIIDFDRCRPSITPAKIEYRTLNRWYGLEHESRKR